jgi:DNA mismatch endonuclease, patch repair protein
MSAEKRSALMAKIKGKNTGPERLVLAALTSHQLTAERHVRELPGCPDFVFRDVALAIFIDGDFWHGWRFPVWRHKLSEKWEAKIEGNRRRDVRNHRRLRQMGWKVMRLWEHQVKQDIELSVKRIVQAMTHPEHSLARLPRQKPGAGSRKPGKTKK